MSPLSPDDVSRIVDYVADELPMDQVNATEAWIAASHERRELVEYLRAPRTQGAEPMANHADLQVIRDGVAALTGAFVSAPAIRDRGRVAQVPVKNDIQRRGFGWQRINGPSSVPRRRGIYAAVVASVVLGVVGTVRFNHPGVRSSQVSPVRTYTTAPGQQSTVTLADGSQAILGPSTTLSVNTGSSEAESPSAAIDVRVNGQVFFTVQHSTTRPFRVQAGNAVAQVLGTQFMVRHYETDHISQVIVANGRVSLAPVRGGVAVGKGQILVANAMGTVTDSGRVQVTPNVAAEDYTAWTMGQLVFHKTPARDAVVELGRAYGIDIRIDDSTLATQQLTWTVPLARQSLGGMLESLADVLDAHIVRNGRIITLRPGRAATRRPIGPTSPLASERQYGK
jgi:ferric-dicitrate binding protein FerR (iron transport regulator)